jgi:hypothetical protein
MARLKRSARLPFKQTKVKNLKQTKKLKQMKAPKILMAGLLAFSIAGVSNAQTVIHVTGSTAFRGAVHQAIQDVLDPSTTTIAYVGSSLPGAGEAIFTGHLYSSNQTITGNQVIIKTYWSGSVGGIQAVTTQLPLSSAWLTNTTPATAAPGTPISSGSAIFDPATPPDVCMSDVYQASTPFAYPIENQLVEKTVAIVPFKWMRNTGSPSTWQNITPQLAIALYGGSGKLPLALFTGLSSDEGTNVYALGRNADSGTRLTAFAESGVGVFSSVQQYYPLNNGNIIKSTGLAVTGQELVPQDTVNGITYPAGNSGYASGGQLDDALGASGSATASGVNGFYAGYLGLSDAYTAETLGASELNYNGVPYSTNAVQEGHYTFWSYEHLDYTSTYNSPSNVGKEVADLIANKLIYQDADVIPTGSAVAAGIRTVFMKVYRSNDGGTIYNNY